MATADSRGPSAVERRSRARAGFTLIEMLLVVLILGALAAMIVPRILPQAEEAKVRIAEVEIGANLPAALDLFLLNVGRYPTTEEGLEALSIRPPSVSPDLWRGPYVQRTAMLDPWGSPFGYAHPARRGGLDYDLWSRGPDGMEGSADDLSNSVSP